MLIKVLSLNETKSFVDVATKIVNDRPELYAKKGLLTNVLFVLAQKTRAFKQKKPHIFVRIINSSKYAC